MTKDEAKDVLAQVDELRASIDRLELKALIVLDADELEIVFEPDFDFPEIH